MLCDSSLGKLAVQALGQSPGRRPPRLSTVLSLCQEDLGEVPAAPLTPGSWLLHGSSCPRQEPPLAIGSGSPPQLLSPLGSSALTGSTLPWAADFPVQLLPQARLSTPAPPLTSLRQVSRSVQVTLFLMTCYPLFIVLCSGKPFVTDTCGFYSF